MNRLLMVTAVMLFWAGTVYAHPPTSIKLNFDKESKVLSVEIKHMVGDPLKHYIKTIEVKEGQSQIIVQNLSSQPDKIIFKVAYTLAGITGNEPVTVKAACNLSGSLEETLKQNDIRVISEELPPLEPPVIKEIEQDQSMQEDEPPLDFNTNDVQEPPPGKQ